MEILEYIRSFRIFEYAIFDLIVSFGGIYLISGRLSRLFLKIGIKIPKNNWLLLVLPLAILFHILTNTYTPMTKDFINLNDYYILKILIISLLFLGLYNVKLINKKN